MKSTRMMGARVAVVMALLACVSTAHASAPARPSVTVRSSIGAVCPVNLRFVCPRTGEASLTICDASGHAVRTVVDGTQSAGAHVATWDGRDDDGRMVQGAAFLAVLEMGGKSADAPFVLKSIVPERMALAR